MTVPFDIIAFCKDWQEPKTSNNHILEALAQRHRVLWVNSIATRAPNLASANDLAKIARKIRSWMRGTEVIHPNLRVLTPVLLPFPWSPWVMRLNRVLVCAQVRREARRWGFRQPQLWIFPPNAVDYAGQFGESRLVYYCVDEWSQFRHLQAEPLRRKERQLLEKADIVFVVSQELLAAKRRLNPRTFLIPHGVNHELFAQALRSDFPAAEPLRALPRPVLGFYGTIRDWVDQELLAGIAQRRPSWSLVLVGKVLTDVSALRRHPNIHLFDSQPYEELPRFCKGFDVGLIPYRLSDPRMQSVNPLKLREYLAAGLPVVSVDLPETRVLSEFVRFAATAEEFVRQIEVAIAEDTAARRIQRSAAMQSESWSARAARVEELLAQS